MWTRLRRRLRGRAQPPLDVEAVERLGELVQRIVTLIPEAAGAPGDAAPAPPEAPAPKAPPPARATLLFVPSPAGYRLVERGDGPAPGARVGLPEGAFRVLRHGPSPLPGDARRCAFLEREEAPAAARTPDR